MLQKIKILDEKLDKLNEINNKKFLFENFKDINSQIVKILDEIKSDRSNNEGHSFNQEQQNTFKTILNKIEKLESKILHKAHLFESFSKTNI